MAVITGGACGIGESTSRLFSKHGAKVIIAGISNDLGKSVCKDLGPETGSFVHCDVSSETDIENAIATALDKHGKLDIMVNNAAIGDPTKLNILENDKADFERVISVNLTGGLNHDPVAKGKHHQHRKRQLERGWGCIPCVRQLQACRRGAHKERGSGARAIWDSGELPLALLHSNTTDKGDVQIRRESRIPSVF